MKTKWIDMAVSQPKDYERVLWFDSRDGFINIGYFVWSQTPVPYATHWMPLPEKPSIDPKPDTSQVEDDINGHHIINASMYLRENGCSSGFNFTFISVAELMAKYHQRQSQSKASQVEQPKEVEVRKTDAELDLIQYVTNLLYSARSDMEIGDMFFDKWVEEQTNLLKEYAQFPAIDLRGEELINKIKPFMYCYLGSGMLTNEYNDEVATQSAKECLKTIDEYLSTRKDIKTVTDEEIEKWADAQDLPKNGRTDYWDGLADGAKAYRDGLISKES